MATVVIITPNTMLDHVSAAAFTAGKVNRVDRFEHVAGGKGLNVGRVLARHGHTVIACGYAGGDTGEQLRTLVAADGQTAAFTPTQARTRIGFAVSNPDGVTSAAIESGFSVSAGEVSALVNDVADVITRCDLVIGCGSVPDLSCVSLWRQILVKCAHVQVPCWLDSYGPAMQEALSCGTPPALVKPNRQEYDADRSWVNSREIHLTDGGAGLKIRHPEGRWRVTPPTIVEKNPIGSGDSYLAGLAHARLAGMALLDQYRYATAAGAANAARADIAQIGPRDIAALVDRVVIIPADADLLDATPDKGIVQ